MTVETPAPLVFEETDIPTRGRTGAPNPFLEAVQAIVGREKSMTVTLPTVNEKQVRAAVAQLTKAGALTTPPVSVRRTVTKVGQATRITFWTRDQITHKKEEVLGDGPAPEANPEPAVEPAVEPAPEPVLKAVPKAPKK